VLEKLYLSQHTSLTSSAEHGVSVDYGADMLEWCAVGFSAPKPKILSKISPNFPK
jgi:hypothetical protein